MKKLTSIILIIAVLAGIGVTGLTASAGTFTTKSAYTGKTYSHYSEYASRKIQNCIDVSEHNGVINWYAVKSAGVTNAIIRIGYRGYGQAGSLQADDYLSENVEGAQKAGVNIGFYFYSQALNTAEAAAEAKYALSKIKQYKFDLPIFYDYEFAEVSTGRLDKAWANGELNKTKMTNNAVSFCDTIKKAGYKAGIYANASFLTWMLDSDRLVKNGYTLWLAIYSTSSTSGSYWHNSHHVYDYWQYSSTGHVKGICGVANMVWLKTTYAGKTGYIRMDNLDFSGAQTAVVANSNGVNMRSGKGTGYSLVQKIPNKAKVTVNEYPTTNCDVNFYYTKTSFEFALQGGVKKITVSWNKQSNASYYRVYSYDSKNGYYRLAQTTATSYTDSGLKDNETKTYLVRWFDKDGNGSSYTKSDNKSAATAPAKPAFKISSATTTTAALSWNKVAGASFYAVYSYDTTAKTYKHLGNTSALSYRVKSLKAKTNYTFLVRAFNSAKVGSGYAVSDNKTVKTAPVAPKFTFKRHSNSIDISWSAVDGANKYRIYSYDKSTKEYKALAATTALSYTHTSLKPNTEYTYLVRSSSAYTTNSDYSTASNKSVKTLISKTDFKLSLSGRNIKVDWNKVAGADSYVVFTYNSEDGKYTSLKRTKDLSYTITNLPYNTEYEILVRAYDSSNVGSTYAPEDNKKITTPPAAVKFALKAYSSGIKISWDAVEGADFYRVYSYNTATKKYSVLGDTKSLSYNSTSLKSNTSYTYLVRAFNAAKSGSAFSLASNKSIKTLLAKPKVKAVSGLSSIKLSWDKVSGASEYKIYAYDTASKTYSGVCITKNTSYLIKNLNSKTQYVYLVRAFNSKNEGSSFSAADNISVTTK